MMIRRTASLIARLCSGIIFVSTVTRMTKFRAIQTTFLPTQGVFFEETGTAISKQQHNPQRFQSNTQLNIDRGMHIINCWSPSDMAGWIYHGNRTTVPPENRAWARKPTNQPKFLFDTPTDAAKLQTNDTLFVPMSRLQDFVQHFLPHISVDVVLLSTPWGLVYPDWVHTVSQNLTSNPHIMAWFTTNIGNYTGGEQYHPKVHPFPLGLKPKMGPAAYRQPVPFYRKVFLQHWNATTTEKTTTLFVSPVRVTNGDRSLIVPPPPRAILGYTEYLQRLASAYYVFSPDGDHPDCHRHYEAIGLGAIPVTQLDPVLYRHFGPPGINVVYANQEFNTTRLAHDILPMPPPATVNRNMVFEEYWMEYVEQVVGRPLQWWDVTANRAAVLQDFVLVSNEPLYLLPADPVPEVPTTTTSDATTHTTNATSTS